MSAGTGPDRRAQIGAGLDAVHERLRAACAAAARDPQDVVLVAVTKEHPATDVAHLAELGVVDVGEARPQQLRDKRQELGEDLAGRLRWHLIGRLQRNKARAVGRLADVVHSVDDPRLLRPLAEGATEVGRTLDCLVQVSLDGDPTRGGVAVADLGALSEAVAVTEGLVLRGLMAVAPLGTDPAVAFERVARLAADVRADHPTATWLSAGMSADLAAAIAHGATHVRVGTAILGSRPVAR